MRVKPCCVALFVAAVAANAGAQESTAARPSVRSSSANGSRLDGVLDGAAWPSADSITHLAQVEPIGGQLPTGRTVVRVLTTGDAMAFGIRADDPAAARITSFARSRDASLTTE